MAWRTVSNDGDIAGLEEECFTGGQMGQGEVREGSPASEMKQRDRDNGNEQGIANWIPAFETVHGNHDDGNKRRITDGLWNSPWQHQIHQRWKGGIQTQLGEQKRIS